MSFWVVGCSSGGMWCKGGAGRRHTCIRTVCHSSNRINDKQVWLDPGRRGYDGGSVEENVKSTCSVGPRNTCLSQRRAMLGALIVATDLLNVSLSPPSSSASSYANDALRVREAKMVMRVLALRGSVPQAWVADFKTALEGYGIVTVSFKPTLEDIWGELSNNNDRGGKKVTTVDAVTVGDGWLKRAIVSGAIQSIEDPERYRYWNLLSGRWKHLVTRNEQGDTAGNGKVFGVPYRWGCTVIVYRKDRLRRRDKEGESIRDWDDLLWPSLRRRIAFMDYPREIVGIALKTLGMSYNSSTSDLEGCGIGYENVERRVRHLLSQAKVVSNKDHVRAYSAGDVDVIVGSSDDLIPLAQKSSNSVIVIPASGTALFADLWCIPKNAAGGAVNGEPSPLVPAWLELCLQPVRANAASGLQKGASPQLLPEKRGAAKACNPLPSSDTASYTIDSRELPPEHILEKSEFLEPLDAESIVMYRKALGLH